MAFIPGDGGGASDSFSVDTEALRAAAPSYFHVGQQVSTLKQNLESIVQLASGDMFLLMECAKMASMLEQLQERISMAMQCAAVGLSRVSVALEVAADSYVSNENTIIDTFTRLEDDTKPWNPPTLPYQGINPGGIVSGIPVQQPQRTPGIFNPQVPSIGTEPGIDLPLPDIIP